MADVEWSVDALDDVDEIGLHQSRLSSSMASLLVSRLMLAGESLRELPRRGRIVPEFGRSDIRELIYQNYRVVYHIEKELVTILHVVHGSRDLRREQRRRPWNLP